MVSCSASATHSGRYCRIRVRWPRSTRSRTRCGARSIRRTKGIGSGSQTGRACAETVSEPAGCACGDSVRAALRSRYSADPPRSRRRAAASGTPLPAARRAPPRLRRAPAARATAGPGPRRSSPGSDERVIDGERPRLDLERSTLLPERSPGRRAPVRGRPTHCPGSTRRCPGRVARGCTASRVLPARSSRAPDPATSRSSLGQGENRGPRVSYWRKSRS